MTGHPHNQEGESEVGRLIAERYRLLKQIGAGAMGTVYEAEDVSGKNTEHVAVKLMHGLGSGPRADQARARFFREAEAGKTIDSINVVPVLDYGVEPEQDQPYMVMGLLDGFDLEELIDRRGALPVQTAVRIVAQAAQGIEAAHAVDVIHRDLKPSNIFLHREPDNTYRVKVCDFGIAKAFAKKEALTATGSILGSPLYMAPEQVMDSKRVSVSADVWGLGITLYTAITGSAPLESQARDITRLMLKLTMEDVPPIQDTAPWVQPQLAEVIHGALIREVDKRCPNVFTLRSALDTFTEGTTTLEVTMLRAISEDERSTDMPALENLPVGWDAVSSDMMAIGDTLVSEDGAALVAEVRDQIERNRKAASKDKPKPAPDTPAEPTHDESILPKPFDRRILAAGIIVLLVVVVAIAML